MNSKNKTCEKCNRSIKPCNYKRHYNSCGVIKKSKAKIYEYKIPQDETKCYCPFCGKLFKNTGISVHIWRMHTKEGNEFNPNRGYINGERHAWNKGKTKFTDERIANHSKRILEGYASGKIASRKGCKGNFLGKHHSEETKEKIRKKRFEYLSKKLGETAWERKSSGKLSYLESWFYDSIIMAHKLVDQYDIINEFPIYPYFIDFAFVNIKLAVELDGKQHFSEKMINHDRKRDAHLISNGWTIYRISYLEINNNTIKDFLNILDTFAYCDKLYPSQIIRYTAPSKSNLKLAKKIDNVNKFKLQILNAIKEYEIDILNKNWINNIAINTKHSRTAIKNFIKLHMKDLYELGYVYDETKNSQYGTCWINNNIINKKIKKDQLNNYLIDGWNKGRRMKLYSFKVLG